MSEAKLKGKRALVTAGAQGIGEAITRRLIECGASVAIHYFSSAENAEALRKLARDRGLNAFVCTGDLTDPDQAAAVVRKSVDALGGLDILINNAGSLVARRRLNEVDTAFWNQVMDVNVRSAQNVTQAAAAELTRNRCSSIVNLSSLAGRKGGHPGSLVYSAAKGAVLTWTRALALELGPQGVRVNAVAPGLILGTSFHNTHTTRESADATIATIPLGVGGTPDDVARAVAFLASEYDGFITGATLDINGGVYSC